MPKMMMRKSSPVDALSRLALCWHPLPLVSGRILDCFRHDQSATDGLPPHSQARIIDLLSRQLIRVRPNACLWVTVDGPGDWFRLEVDRLIKRTIPTVVLAPDQKIEHISDFKPMACPEERQTGFQNHAALTCMAELLQVVRSGVCRLKGLEKISYG